MRNLGKHAVGGGNKGKQRERLEAFLPAAKPTGHRMVRVVVAVVGGGLL